MKISIVIAAYNEQGSIRDVARRTKKSVPGAEVIVVDDGSTDNTYKEAKKSGARVITYKKNKGHLFALKTGYKKATGDIIGTLDADGTYPPEDFPKLIKAIKDADIVIGSRFMNGFAKGLPLYRNIANIAGAWVISLINLKRVTDATTGMRIFRKKLTKLIPEKIEPRGGLDYEVSFTTKAISMGYRYKEVSIGFEERRGKSKLRFFRDMFKFFIAAMRARLS